MPLLELLVDVLGAADEPHRGHAVAPRVERRRGRLDERGVVGEAEVVVRAEVEHLRAAAHPDVRTLRRGEDPLGLEGPGGADGIQLLRQGFGDGSVHVRSLAGGPRRGWISTRATGMGRRGDDGGFPLIPGLSCGKVTPPVPPEFSHARPAVRLASPAGRLPDRGHARAGAAARPAGRHADLRGVPR